jgi:DNA-binding MarR family transcriptional regulator
MPQISENGIKIELSKAQINQVVREASEDDGLLGLLGGLEDLDVKASSMPMDDVRLSRSLLRGLMVLASYPTDGSTRSVTDVAHQLGMGISTTHRYTSTLVEVGVLERDPESRQYRLAKKS